MSPLVPIDPPTWDVSENSQYRGSQGDTERGYPTLQSLCGSITSVEALDSFIWFSSPGKINLHLETGSILPNGYHEIRSIFHTVDLADSVGLRLTEHHEIRVGGNFNCSLEKNLIYKAACAYQKSYSEKVGKSFGVDILCKKTIPTGAGLGGGSSNAATTLLGLQYLLGFSLPFTKLLQLGSRLGADVSFFLYRTPLALVEGVGDVITPLVAAEDTSSLEIVVKPHPHIHTATPEAYAALDNLYPKGRQFSLSVEELVTMIGKTPDTWEFFNIFEQVDCIMVPEIHEALGAFRQQYPFASLSGSGSSIFAVKG